LGEVSFLVLSGAIAIVFALAIVVVFDDHLINKCIYRGKREIAGYVLAPLTAGIFPSFADAARTIILNPNIYGQLDAYSTIKTFFDLSLINFRLYSGFGIPVAYSVSLFLGLPIYIALRNRGWDSSPMLIAVASAVGLTFGFLTNLKPIISYAGAGVLMAIVFVLVRGPRQGSRASTTKT
jgi:hypothetical protein